MTRDTWRLGHRPGLDGLRAVAVLLVVAAHVDVVAAFHHPSLGVLRGAGTVGVDVFFALSGFLITSLLLEEYARRGRVSLRRFYARRGLRLLPALATVLLAVGALRFSGNLVAPSAGMFAAAAGYVGNWYLFFAGADFNADSPLWVGIGHTWSLAIEEQFYLLWPLVLLALARRGPRAVLRGALAGCGLSLCWGAVSGHSRLDTFVSAWPLLAGCALAAWMQLRPSGRPSAVWSLVVLAVVPLSFGTGTPMDATRHLLAPAVAVAVMWVVAHRQVPWLEVPPLRWIGRRSYGIYLWHYPAMFLASGYPSLWLQLVVMLLLTVALAAISWRYLEEPILRRGRAWLASAPAPMALVPVQ